MMMMLGGFAFSSFLIGDFGGTWYTGIRRGVQRNACFDTHSRAFLSVWRYFSLGRRWCCLRFGSGFLYVNRAVFCPVLVALRVVCVLCVSRFVCS